MQGIADSLILFVSLVRRSDTGGGMIFHPFFDRRRLYRACIEVQQSFDRADAQIP